MRALAYLVVLGLVFYVVWRFLGRNAGPKTKLGPDGFDTTALSRDLPGDTHKIKAPIPGRDVELAEDLLPEQPLRNSHGFDAPTADADRGRVILFRGRPGARSDSAINADIDPGSEADIDPDVDADVEEVQFTPDVEWSHEMAEEVDWDGLNDPMPLPSRYTEEAITALVRNPRSLYVYWERANQTDENLLTTLGEEAYRKSTPCLRITDVTPGADPGQLAGRKWLQDVSELDDHWFVQDGIEPDHTYEISFGRRTADGRYIVLSHSLPVRTPHDSPAPAAGESMLYQLYVGQPGGQAGSPQWR